MAAISACSLTEPGWTMRASCGARCQLACGSRRGRQPVRQHQMHEFGLAVGVSLLERSLQQGPHRSEADVELAGDVSQWRVVEQRLGCARLGRRQVVELAQRRARATGLQSRDRRSTPSRRPAPAGSGARRAAGPPGQRAAACPSGAARRAGHRRRWHPLPPADEAMQASGILGPVAGEDGARRPDTIAAAKHRTGGTIGVDDLGP